MPDETFQIDLYPVTAELWNLKMEVARIGDAQLALLQDITANQAAMQEVMPTMFGVGLGFGFIAALLVALIWSVTWKL